jgi:predicted PurR-regulated permease PerM
MNDLFSRVDQRYAKICLYAGVTVVATYAAITLLQSAFPVFSTAWNLLRAVVEPLVYGGAISYVLTPLVGWVSRAIERGGYLVGPERASRRRYVSVIITLILVALFVLAIVAVFVLMITHSLSNLRISELRAFFDSVQGNLMSTISEAQAKLVEWGVLSSGSGAGALSIFNSVRDAASTMVFAVIFGVYFLFDGERVTRWVGRFTRVVLGGRNIDPAPILSDVDRVFSGYFRGQAIDGLTVGLSSGVLLTIIGVPYAPLVGLLAGLGNLIPYVGGPVGFASIALLCIAESAWPQLVGGFVVMAVVMFVDANVINPMLLSDNVEIHPILVLAALIAGGVVGGLAGMLVAVPTAAFLKIQIDRWLDEREHALVAEGIITLEDQDVE